MDINDNDLKWIYGSLTSTSKGYNILRGISKIMHYTRDEHHELYTSNQKTSKRKRGPIGDRLYPAAEC